MFGRTLRILAAVILAAAVATPPAAEAAGLDAVLTKKTLVVATPKGDRYPYCYTNSKGELVGSDVDLVSLIAGKRPVELKFDRTAENHIDVIRKVVRNEADLGISGMKLTLPNVARTSFTRPYLTVRYALMVNRVKLGEFRKKDDTIENVLVGFVHKDEPINTLNARLCKKIGTLDRPSYIAYAKRQFPGAKIEAYPDMHDLVKALVGGRIAAAFCDEVECRTAYARYPRLGVNARYVTLEDVTDDIAMAVSWRNQHFRAWLNLYLEAFPPKLNVDRILEEYPLAD